MTIGATTTFTQTRDEICTDALINLGAVAPGKDASAARTAGLLTHAARALNRLVKSLDADGELLWRVVRRSIQVANFDVSTSPPQIFTLAADVLDVDEPMIYTPSAAGSQGTQITSMTRDEFLVCDRDTKGTPTRYFAERTLAGLTITLNPGNEDDSGATIEYAAYTKAADFNSGAETPDYLQSWTCCLVYGLTAELAPAYNQAAKSPLYRQWFQEEKAKLLANDNERGNLRLVPFGGARY